MKLKFLLLLPLLLFALLPAARSQDDGSGSPATIRITTTLHNDGSKTVMQTDPDNHTATSSTYDHADRLLSKIVYDLDDQGVALGGSVFSAKGVLLYKMRYVYDDAKRVSEVDSYSVTDQLLSRQVYHYDANNRVIRIDTFDGNGNPVTGTSSSAASTPPKMRNPGQNH